MVCSRSSERRLLRAALFSLAGAVLAAGCGGSETKTTPDGGAQAPVTFNPTTHNFMNATVGTTTAAVEFTITNTGTSTLTNVSAALVGVDVAHYKATGTTCMGTMARNASCKYSVAFAPTGAGVKNAAVEFRAGGATKQAALTGTGIRSATLTVTPVSGEYGPVAVGTESEVKTFTVKNEGGVEAPRPMVTPAADFPVKMNNCSAALPAGGMCTLTVAFAPTTVGSRMGILSVSIPDATAFMVALSGTGVERPSVVASPSSVDFGEVAVGRTSTAQTVTLRNTTNAAVTGLAITSGNPGSFAVAGNTCAGNMIPANGMCTVSVTFTPGAAGEVKSELTVNVAGGTPTGVPLSGTGIRAALLELTSQGHDFGSVPVGQRQGGLTLTVANIGQQEAANVNIALAGADAGEFEIEPNCPTTLAAAATCDIRVFFKPANEGAAVATLNVTGNPGGADMAELKGNGVKAPGVTIAPTSGDFSTVQVGQTSTPVAFTVTNTGGAATGALTFAIVGTEFKIVSGTSDACAPGLGGGQMCMLQVQFTPTSAGAKSSTLTVSGATVGMVSATLSGTAIDSARLVITPPSSGFGSVAVGQMSNEVLFTVTNAGGTDSGAPTITAGSAQFQVSSNACQNNSLTPGETCQVGVRFVPATVGDFSSNLSATATPGGTATAALMGAGTAPASISFQNGAGVLLSVYDFGPTEVQVGAMTMPVTVFVRNTGTVGTGMLATVLGGTNAGDFVIVDGSNSCTAGLAPGAVCSMQVIFKPTVGGAREATITVTSGSGGVTSLLLKGPGVEAIQFYQLVGGMEQRVSSYDFGSLSAGQAGSPVEFRLRAVGAASGTYTINLDGGGTPPNFVRTGGSCDGTNLAMGTFCTVLVRFQPQLPLGAKTGSLGVTTSAGRSTAVALAGSSGGPLQFSPAPHNFGSLATGNSSIVNFTLSNNGVSAITGLSVALATTSSDLSIAESSCGPTLAPANMTDDTDICVVKVRFLAGATAGAKTATLNATGSFLAGGSPQTATASSALTATVTAAAQIAVTGNGDFGMVGFGSTSDARTFTVSNAAGSPVSGGVTISGIPTTGPADFVLTRNGCVQADNTTPLPLAAGQSCTFDVRFSPQATGPLSDTVLVSASPGGAVSTVLNGVGLTTVTLEPGAQDLDAGGNLNVLGATNRRFEFTVTNRGSTGVMLTPSLEVSTVLGAAMDGPTYFNILPSATAPCPATLAAGATCKIDVLMVTPMGGTAGRKFARLQVTGGTAPSTATAELAGTLRTDAVLEFGDTAPRAFGSVKVGSVSESQVVQVRNSGGVPSGAFQISPIPAGFRRSPETGTNPATGNTICSPGIVLAPSAICEFLLQFAPTTVGAAAGTLDIWVTGAGSGSASALMPKQLALSGTGVAAANTISLSPTPVSFGGAGSGGAAVDRTVVLTNGSGAALAIGSIALVGPAAGFSVVSNTCGASVAAGLTCDILVRFTPTGAPARLVDTLRVVATPMGGGAQTVDAALVGFVLTAPAFTIEPPSEGADWGGTLIGSSSKRTFLVRNTGEVATGVAATVAVSGANASEFVLGDNTCTGVLAANATCSVSITFSPVGATGGRTATLTASAAGVTMDTQVLDGDAVVPSAVQLVSVQGGGMVAAFGNKAVLSETALDVVIRNAAASQTITAATFTLSDTVNFRVDTNAGTADDCFDALGDGGGLTGGEDCTVRVFFRPQSLPASTVAAPNMAATLTVGGANTPLVLQVNGNAVSALSIAPATRAYGNVAVNGTSSQTFVVTNSADAGITATGLVSVALDGANAGDYRISRNTCATTMSLAPGATCEVDVAFEPKSAGAKAASLNVTATPTNGATATLTGTGT